MYLKVDGEYVNVFDGTLVVDDSIEERTTIRAVLEIAAGSYVKKGQPFQIGGGYPEQYTEGYFGGIQFAGIVDDAATQITAPDVLKIVTVDGVDWHYLADRRRFAQSWEDTTADVIVKWVVDNVLNEEGVTYTAGSVQVGPNVKQAFFNYISPARAFDRLATESGYSWWIDRDKVLWFVDRSAVTAPWTLTWDDLVAPPTVDDGQPQYRNRQYVLGGTNVTSSQVQTFQGDGKTRSFTLPFKVAKAPTIELNTVSQTVGIRGVDTGDQWYWNKGDAVISQDLGGTPIGSGDTLEVTYQGEFPVIAIVNDEGEITRTADLEGSGSGKVEEVTTDRSLASLDAAFEEGQSLLDKYAEEGRTLKFRTQRPGLESGQLLTVDLPEYHDQGEDTEYLITAVKVVDMGGGIAEFAVTAIQGPVLGSWVRYFQALQTATDELVLRENLAVGEVLALLKQLSESWTWTESVTKSEYVCHIPSPTMIPSPTLIPC